jgi:hypothetical protein
LVKRSIATTDTLLLVVGWLADMKAHEYMFDEGGTDILDESVQMLLAHTDLHAVETQRDQVLIRLLKDKTASSALV